MMEVPSQSKRKSISSCRSVTMLLLWLTVVMAEWGVCGAVPVPPSIRIVVRVRKRRATHWEPWQLNSNVCPPSLCRQASEGSSVPAPRPRGTGGSVFYQGDIVLDNAVDRYIFPEVNQTRFRRAAVRLRNRQWKDGVIPYTIGGTVSARTRKVILRAFKHISKKTCITFRKKKSSDKDFIKFIDEPGCWSAIGQTGGRQLLSLGRGCENIGTAVHEITHSLGVWHEQARSDRDQYVRLIEDNISERFLKDFEKVDRRVSTSRGFPYDYTSVMHYSRFAFTRNGKPTIEVIGQGRKLGLTIKQRSGLSTIDMAQLRDMYRCNLQTDTNETRCPEGWHRHDAACYKFFRYPKVQFAAAMKKCREENSHLVWIESGREDRFLARHLLKTFPREYTWRIGARRVNDSMTWYRGKDSKPAEVEYSNWADDHPATYSSGVLQRDRSTNVTRWQGVWAGSMSQLPNFVYPFICERRAKRQCLKLRRKDGRDYRGKLDHTMDGYTCQKWSEQYPHQHNLTSPDSDFDKEDADGLGDHNYCRNPKKQRRSRPWCHTTKTTRHWQLCDVTSCARSASSLDRLQPSQKDPDGKYRQLTQQSSQRGRRHSDRKRNQLDRPRNDDGDRGVTSNPPSSGPSRKKRPGKGRRREKGKRRRRPGRKGRRVRDGSRRRRGRRVRKRNRSKGQQQE